ncbi:PE family protein [Mycobacterium shinjukuense]|uniref:PE family protein n=1 Tax=Mycobacterium shinjukuense TaxID=398694 RepID=A0A7I7MTA7_9MYCO|nr:PE family protein [Mycobacterium shinjukuense]MCV6986557.1 PE family protein [Mycobacterium shinjukuense]ORB67315.1 hypothetical protein BST45_12895 [Mycobacterium shinjukuense]BBX75518.1 PE family protein [Mycobacterium shinjukuense]
MSFVVTAPEAIADAARNLVGIGSTVREATAAAAGPTTGIAAAAADEVSTAISRLFGTFGQEFQAVSAQAAAFHAEFVRLLNGGAAAYLGAEIANAGQALTHGSAAALLSSQVEAGATAVSGAVASVPGLQGLNTTSPPGLWTPGAAAVAAVPGGAYGQLVVNTATNLQALGNAWAAHPFPFLSQVLANQLGYWQQIAAAMAGAIQNLPASLANVPAAIQAGIQQLLAFNWAYYIQQFISTQIGFAQLFGATLNHAVTGLVAGLPNFGAGLELAFQQLLVGNYYGAVTDLGQAFANLLVTGADTSNVTITVQNLTVIITAKPVLLGPLGDLFTLMNIPGQEAQYFTNLMPPSIPRQMAQNFTNVLNTLTTPSISATVTIPVLNPSAGTLSTFFGLPLVLTYGAAGPPFATLNALASSAEVFNQALATGNVLGAAGVLIDAPAVALNGFLNGNTPIDMTILVPTGLPNGLPQTVAIILHMPFDGILVPPHPITATIDPHLSGVNPINVTIFGTPFSGLVPLFVNYIPQQLALAIKPAG